MRYARLNICLEDKMGGKSNINNSRFGLYLPSSMTALVNGRLPRSVRTRPRSSLEKAMKKPADVVGGLHIQTEPG
jgi:hypothetical protein